MCRCQCMHIFREKRKTCFYLLDLVYYSIPNMLQNAVSLYNTLKNIDTGISITSWINSDSIFLNICLWWLDVGVYQTMHVKFAKINFANMLIWAFLLWKLLLGVCAQVYTFSVLYIHCYHGNRLHILHFELLIHSI